MLSLAVVLDFEIDFEGPSEGPRSHIGLARFHPTPPHDLVGRKVVGRCTESHLELADRLIEESHLHVGRAKVVVRRHVVGRHMFRDLVLELVQHLGEVRFFIP